MQSKISSLEHIAIAEAMVDLETSIAFAYGSVELEDSSLPSIRRVVRMLRRHSALKLALEAHLTL